LDKEGRIEQAPHPPLAAPGASGYFPFIDGLRAIAVLGVILFHFNLAHVSGGYVGVDVFFVLSGFLITNLIAVRLQRQAFSFAHFYERRARRILPALFLTCVLSGIAALWLLVPHDLREFAKSLKATAFFYSNIVFAQATGYFAEPLSSRPLLHTWSLAVEEQFYFVFPPLLYAMHWLTGGRRGWLWLAMAVLFGISLYVSIVWVQANAASAFYLLPPRAWELLAGSLIALAPRTPRLPRIVAEAVALLGAIGIGLSFALYDRNTPFPGMAALLPCGATVFLIVPNLAGRTLVGRILAHPWLVYIGLISYGLYLYHWPILAFTRYFLDHDLTGVETGIALAATASLAFISYQFIEVPVRSGKYLPTRKQVFQAAAAGILIIGIFGIAAVNGDGFPGRFSGAALQYAAAGHDKWPWDKCMPPVEQLDAGSVCKVGRADVAPSFLVWGDSHAAALAPGVDARAKTLSLAGWVVGYSRCASLVGAAPMQHVRDDYPCPAIGEKVLKLVRENHLKHVLLVSRWDTYISGWERGGTETTQDLTISYTDTDGSRSTGLAAFRLSLEETLRRLRELDVDIWILEQVPPQLVDVPSALAKAIYFGRDPAALERPFGDVEVRRDEASTVFADFRDTRGVSFIDPAEKFCPEESACLIAAEGHALYADGNHLSVYGAIWSQRMLDPFFSSIVR
jgi:peptidoglycan/LPS O-acetylase OafA/YrhL